MFTEDVAGFYTYLGVPRIRLYESGGRDRVTFSGTWNGVERRLDPLSVKDMAPGDFDVIITIRQWEIEGVPTSYRVPIIFDEVLKFYFDENYEEAREKIFRLEKGYYTAGTGTNSRPFLYNGESQIIIGYPGQDMNTFKGNTQFAMGIFR